MDATHLDTFVDALIEDLTPTAAREGDRTLFHLLDSPRRIGDDQAVVAVLAAAVTLRNLADHVIAPAVAAAERAGIPARRHLRTGTDLLTALGMAPGVAYRAARVGRSERLFMAAPGRSTSVPTAIPGSSHRMIRPGLNRRICAPTPDAP